jgi:hypothetical protein
MAAVLSARFRTPMPPDGGIRRPGGGGGPPGDGFAAAFALAGGRS